MASFFSRGSGGSAEDEHDDPATAGVVDAPRKKEEAKVLATYLLHPLYYVRSGDIRVSDGHMWVAGTQGFTWSGSAATLISPTEARAYYLGFNASRIFSSGGPDTRWFGLPLRWLKPCFFTLGFFRKTKPLFSP